MVGRVESYLLEKIRSEGPIHMTLVDPAKITASLAAIVAENSKNSGTSAIMIGGSTSISQNHLDDIVNAIKKAVEIPTILFPSGINGISRHADAVWFMSLLNSEDPNFLIRLQVMGAPIVKKIGIEPIPMGYIIVGDGGTAGKIGKAISIPYDMPELAANYALAGQYFGMRFIYLEGGSGATTPVPPEMIRAVKNSTNVTLIVGGGIRTKEQALAAASAGADIIVTGNIIETADAKQRVAEIINGIRETRIQR